MAYAKVSVTGMLFWETKARLNHAIQVRKPSQVLKHQGTRGGLAWFCQ